MTEGLSSTAACGGGAGETVGVRCVAPPPMRRRKTIPQAASLPAPFAQGSHFCAAARGNLIRRGGATFPFCGRGRLSRGGAGDTTIPQAASLPALAAARSRRGSDVPPAHHSTPRRRFATFTEGAVAGAADCGRRKHSGRSRDRPLCFVVLCPSELNNFRSSAQNSSEDDCRSGRPPAPSYRRRYDRSCGTPRP